MVGQGFFQRPGFKLTSVNLLSRNHFQGTPPTELQQLLILKRDQIETHRIQKSGTFLLAVFEKFGIGGGFDEVGRVPVDLVQEGFGFSGDFGKPRHPDDADLSQFRLEQKHPGFKRCSSLLQIAIFFGSAQESFYLMITRLMTPAKCLQRLGAA